MASGFGDDPAAADSSDDLTACPFDEPQVADVDLEATDCHTPLHVPHPPHCPSGRSPRFAHLRSAYSARAFSAREPEHPRRPPPTPIVQKWLKAALSLKSLHGASTEVLEDVLFELQERRKELATSRRFKRGAKYHAAILHLNEFYMSCQKVAAQKAEVEEYERQAVATREAVQAYDTETQQLINELARQQAARREALLENHHQERFEHSQKWDSVRKSRMYSRPSNRVTALRHQQTLLAVQCRFQEADAFTKVIGEQTATEQDDHAMSRQRDYDLSIAALKKKQQSEIEFFDEHAEIELRHLKQQRENSRRVFENMERKVEARAEFVKDQERCWSARVVQRQRDVAPGVAFATSLPLSHLKKDDLEKKEIRLLTLPPLRLDRDSTSAQSRRRLRTNGD